MELIPQFLKFFEDFIKLCQLNNWPNEATVPEEIRNAFLIAQHIEKCLDKFQQKLLLDDFLSVLSKNQNTSNLFFKQCFSDPPKYVLKKIINSSANVAIIDESFTIFLELFSEDKFESYLSDFMLEAASKDILLKNLVKEFPKDVLLDFKSRLFLLEIIDEVNSTKVIREMLGNCNSDVLEVLMISLLNKDYKYNKAVSIIRVVFTDFMSNSHGTLVKQNFWKLLFQTDELRLTQLCLNHADIYRFIMKAFLDSGKLIKNNMSMKYFYINLTISELSSTFKVICKDENLKLEFFDFILINKEDVTFWNNLLECK